MTSVLKHPGWKTAMIDEIEVVANNHTWDLIPRTPEMNVVR